MEEGKLYIGSFTVNYPYDIITMDTEGRRKTLDGPAYCDLSISGDKTTIHRLIECLRAENTFNFDGFSSLFQKKSLPARDPNRCSYCGKKYDSDETNCRGCGGPR